MRGEQYLAESWLDRGVTGATARAMLEWMRHGDARATVLDGETGVSFGEQTTEAIADAVRRFDGIADRLTAARCREDAERFSVERFRREFRPWVDREISMGAQGLEPRTSAV